LTIEALMLRLNLSMLRLKLFGLLNVGLPIFRSSFLGLLIFMLKINAPQVCHVIQQDTIVVAFGIAFGNPLSDSVVAKARYAGCAKIVGVG